MYIPTHTRTHARTHARTHTHTRARAHTHTHIHTHTHTQQALSGGESPGMDINEWEDQDDRVGGDDDDWDLDLVGAAVYIVVLYIVLLYLSVLLYMYCITHDDIICIIIC